jgi:altronate dehydratase
MRAVLVISERDNVATALEPLEPGRQVEARAVHVIAIDAIPAGHKIAIRPIAAGAEVFKYGSPIGTAIGDIAAGAHVHTHNVASSRGRGDLQPASPETEGRLAEPPDVPQTARTH